MHKLTVMEVRYIQSHLGETKVDGLLGPQTYKTIRKVTGYKGPETHVVYYYIQCLINKQAGKPVVRKDGIFGAQTDYHFAKLMKQKMPVRSNITPIILTNSPSKVSKPTRFDIIGSNPPKRNTHAIKSKFGNAGDTSNLVRMIFPYNMYYSGKRVKSTRVHKKSKAALEYIFEKTLAHYGQAGIDQLNLSVYGGCYSFRKMRGGKAQSTHSWGIAMDLDPANNRLRAKRGTAKLANIAYQPFWNFVYEAGFISLGLERNYDWMHIQHTQ